MPTIELPWARVDDAGQVTRRDGTHAALTPTELALLRFLSAHPGRTLTRREIYAAVWGHAKALNTRTLDVAIGTLRAKVEPTTVAETILTDRGKGYRFHQRSAGTSALPKAGARLAGRQQEVDALHQLQLGSNLVTISGPAGVGKSHLALEVSQRREPPPLYLDATTCASPEQLLLALARVLDSGSDVETIRKVLAEHPEGLFLDNADDLLDTVAALLTQPRYPCLVTAREPLRIAGERVLVLAPLDVPASIDVLRARANDAEEALLERIARAVEGLPLALELAGARLESMDAAEVATQVERSLEILADTSRGAHPRHRTLDTALFGTWNRMDPIQQRALRLFATTRGGFDLRSAIALVGESAVELLDALVRKSLVKRDGHRYDLLRVVRDFATNVEADPPWPELLGLHAEAYTRRMRELRAAFLAGDEWVAAHSRMVADLPNFLAILERAEARLIAPSHHVTLLRGLGGTLSLTAPSVYLRHLTDALRRPLDAEDRATLQAHLWVAKANHADLDLGPERLPELLTEGLSVAARADLYIGAAAVHRRAGRFDEATRAARASFDAAASQSLLRLMSHACVTEMMIAVERGDAVGALAARDRAYECAERANARYLFGILAVNGANVLLMQGRLAEAESDLSDAVTMNRDMRNPTSESAALLLLSCVRCEQGRFDEAVTDARTAKALVGRLGSRVLDANAQETLAVALLGAGHPREAFVALARANLDLETLGHRAQVHRVWAILAMAAAGAGDVGAVQHWLAKARQCTDREGTAMGEVASAYADLCSGTPLAPDQLRARLDPSVVAQSSAVRVAVAIYAKRFIAPA